MVFGLVLIATPAFAADGAPLISFTASFGAAVTIIGASLGFAKIGSAALESIARQPEAAGDIRGAMLLAAALLEGATFFALIVCIVKGAA
ncbi:MAG: ATP synthase F0 subunit C [Planctomycetes bacterium]|nr:ATP synthase F0 subunit C [Planctomycetota bacterium]